MALPLLEASFGEGDAPGGVAEALWCRKVVVERRLPVAQAGSIRVFSFFLLFLRNTFIIR